MNKPEFRQALQRNRMTVEEFAALIGRDPKTVYEFGGRSPVPFYARFTICVIDEIGPDRALFLAGFRKKRK